MIGLPVVSIIAIIGCAAIASYVIWKEKHDKSNSEKPRLTCDDFTMKPNTFRETRLIMFQDLMDSNGYKRINHLPGVGGIVYRKDSQDRTITIYPMMQLPHVYIKKDGCKNVKMRLSFDMLKDVLQSNY